LYNVSGDFIVCLTAYNEANCPDTTCQPLTAIVNNIVDVPTGFTPNGDGTNDFVTIRGYGIKSLVFRIYNRWGELVFETTSKDKSWDGKYKGVLQEMDAFAYILDATFTDNSNVVKKGSITLIR
jgi:gliding motility-associated-like protein